MHSLFRIAFIVSAVVVIATPPFELPAPTGPASIVRVGYEHLVADGCCSSRATVWYPTSSHHDTVQAYLVDDAPWYGALRGFAAAVRADFETLRPIVDVRTHAAPSGEVQAGPLPVLIFSHGYTAIADAYTALLEDLASHGFFVVSVLHGYEDGETSRVFAEWTTEDATVAAVTAAHDDREKLRLTRRYLASIPETTRILGRWSRDIRAALDNLSRDFGSHIDPSRVGVFGHSMGGVASAQFCLEDARCKAVLNLDGIPQYGALIDGQLKRPLLMVYSARPGRLGASDVVYKRAASPYYRVDVRDTLHLDFSDMAFWPTLRDRKIVGPLPAERAVALTRAIVFEYFDQELNGRPSPLLAGTRREPEVTVARFARKPI